MRELSGYWVIKTDLPNPHHSGIAVFYRKVENFTLVVLHFHGPKYVSFHMTSGGGGGGGEWHVVG